MSLPNLRGLRVLRVKLLFEIRDSDVRQIQMHYNALE